MLDERAERVDGQPRGDGLVQQPELAQVRPRLGEHEHALGAQGERDARPGDDADLLELPQAEQRREDVDGARERRHVACPGAGEADGAQGGAEAGAEDVQAAAVVLPAVRAGDEGSERCEVVGGDVGEEAGDERERAVDA